MRIKSKDIHFVQSIFYLANKKNIDTSLFFLRHYSVGQKLFKCKFIFLVLKLKEPAVPHLQAHDDRINSDYLI